MQIIKMTPLYLTASSQATEFI